MRKALLVAALCGCGLLLATAAAAAPSHLGPTGIVGTPTADVVGARQYDVAVDYVKWEGDIKSWPIRLVTGVSDKVEVGIGYSKWKDTGVSMKVVPINVKAVVVPESESSPAVAVGAAYGKLKDGSTLKVTTLYAVATKTLTKAEDDYEDSARGTVRGSLGLMYNKYKDGGSDSYTEPFVSLEYMTPGGATTLAIEYKTAEGGMDPVSSLLVRHTVTPNMWVQAGLTDAVYTMTDNDHEFFIGFGYRWAPPAEDEWYY